MDNEFLQAFEESTRITRRLIQVGISMDNLRRCTEALVGGRMILRVCDGHACHSVGLFKVQGDQAVLQDSWFEINHEIEPG